MAHNIQIINGEGQMFSASNLTPWHGLGKVLDKPLNAEEALRQGGLDFIVVKKDLLTIDGTPVPNKFATVREDTGQVLGVVGNIYTPVQNNEAFAFFDPIIERGEAIYETGGVLGKGEKVWIMAALPEHIKVAGHDEIKPYVTILTSHDGSSGVKAFFNFTRIVCNNTLTAALGEKEKSVNIRHTSGAMSNLKQAYKILGLANLYVRELDVIFNRMATTKISITRTKEYVDLLFPAPPEKLDVAFNLGKRLGERREEVMHAIANGVGQDLDTTQGTVFGFYNGVAHWLDHSRVHKDETRKLEAIWFYESADLRQQAFNLCRSLSNN